MTKKNNRTVIVVIVIAAIGLAFLAGMWKERRAMRPEITSSLIANSVSSMQDLITTEYHYTNMGSIKAQTEFYGWKIPFTEKGFILSYEGTIYTGIDIRETDIEVLNKKIVIKLPQPHILSHEIKEDSITVFDEKTSLLNPLKIEDYTSFSSDQKQEMEKKAIQNGLFSLTTENTKKAIEEILHLNPFIPENYEIEFR